MAYDQARADEQDAHREELKRLRRTVAEDIALAIQQRCVAHQHVAIQGGPGRLCFPCRGAAQIARNHATEEG